MRGCLKRIVGWVAVYAIVLQTLAVGFQPAIAAPSAFDPLGVICHNGDTTPSADNSDRTGTPAKARCGECVLCVATPSPSTPAVSASIEFIARPAFVPALTDAAPPAAGALHTTQLPRGPPQST